jgi:hypothetical protein
MSGSYRLHNKFHRSSHHSLSSTSVQDQGIDPIASKNEPFNGIFYNNLTDQNRTYNTLTNSYDWYSTHTTVHTLSPTWNLIGTTYTTVCANSADWDKGFSAYTTLCATSSNYDSTYTTVCANSAFWANEYVLYTNRVQENTRSKTFRGYNLSINPDNTVDWNLDIAQVAYLKLDRNVVLKNPLQSSMKSGGLYNLHVIQAEPGGYTITFESDYIFPVGIDITDVVNGMNFALSGVTIFNFFSDSIFMYGDFYKTNILDNGVGIVTFTTNKQMIRFGNFDPIYPFSETFFTIANEPLVTIVDEIGISSII